MKKLVLTLAIIIAVGAAVVSCSRSRGESAKELKSKIENTTNADSLRTYIVQARAHAIKLEAEGKTDEAKRYIADIKSAVMAKVPTLTGVAFSIEEAFDDVKESAAYKAEDAKDKAEAAADSAKNAVGSAADAIKEKAEDAAEATKKKAVEVKNATVEAAKKGADEVKEFLK